MPRLAGPARVRREPARARLQETAAQDRERLAKIRRRCGGDAAVAAGEELRPHLEGLRAVVRAAHGDLAGELEDLLVRGGPIDRRTEDRVQERPASPHRGELDGGTRLGRCPRTQLSDDQPVEPGHEPAPRHPRERAQDPQAQRAVDAAEVPEQRLARRDRQLGDRVAREDLQARLHAHAPRDLGAQEACHLLGAHARQLEHGALGELRPRVPARLVPVHEVHRAAQPVGEELDGGRVRRATERLGELRRHPVVDQPLREVRRRHQRIERAGQGPSQRGLDLRVVLEEPAQLDHRRIGRATPHEELEQVVPEQR